MTCDEINLNVLESVATEFWRFSTGLSDALFCSNRKCSLWISNTCSFILKTIWWAWSTISRSSVMNMKWRAKQQKQIPHRLVSNVVQNFDLCSLEKRSLQKRRKSKSRPFHHSFILLTATGWIQISSRLWIFQRNVHMPCYIFVSRMFSSNLVFQSLLNWLEEIFETFIWNYGTGDKLSINSYCVISQFFIYREYSHEILWQAVNHFLYFGASVVMCKILT